MTRSTNALAALALLDVERRAPGPVRLQIGPRTGIVSIAASFDRWRTTLDVLGSVSVPAGRGRADLPSSEETSALVRAHHA